MVLKTTCLVAYIHNLIQYKTFMVKTKGDTKEGHQALLEELPTVHSNVMVIICPIINCLLILLPYSLHVFV